MTATSPLDIETFSTPPSTPSAFLQQPRPTLPRKHSKPQSITIDGNQDRWRNGQQVQLEQDPSGQSSPHPNLPPHHSMQKSSSPSIPTRLQGTSPGAAALLAHSSPLRHSQIHPTSPCFVHSHLDKGASLSDWLRNGGGGRGGNTKPVDPLQTREMQPPTSYPSSQYSSHTSSPTSTNSLGFMPSPSDLDDDEDGVGSLTRQLAATAVGVREMSKQLGRARVRSNIQNVMIITKARDNRLIQLTRDLALYLMQKPRETGRGLTVYVDNQLRRSKRFDAEGIERDYPELFIPHPRRRSSSSHSLASMTSEPSPSSTTHNSGSTNGMRYPADEGQLRYWTSDMCSKSPHLFDFVVTLGGDGTVLFTSWLFQRIVPPVLPFALGSLGFLTNFDFADHREVMDMAIDSGIRVNLRMRFTCTVYRAVKPEDELGGKRRKAVKKGETGEIMMKNIEKGGWEALEGGYTGPSGAGTPKCRDKEIMCFTTRPVESFEVLNDLVVDRGPSPYVSLLELFGDEHHMTTVQADGLTVSTPTGSTAYSLSAGGSLVHPEIPALLITPICPHTLSFRPMLLPDTMELRICVPYNSRSTAWASFDGRGRVELKQGDHIKVTASQFPFPTVCADKQSTDWFHAISRTLKWNERERQKSFVVVEEGPEKPRAQRKKSSVKPDGTPVAEEDIELGPGDEEDDTDDDEDDEDAAEEEKFDIDDSSPEANEAKGAQQSPPPPSSTSPKSARGHITAFEIQGEDMDDARSASGIHSPGRFGEAAPHPPRVHARHLVEELRNLRGSHHRHTDSNSSAEGNGNTEGSSTASPRLPPANGSEEIQLPRLLQAARAKIHSRDMESERTPRGESSMRTPRPTDIQQQPSHNHSRNLGRRGVSVGPGTHPTHRRGKSASEAAPVRRAFAVYGQDESDSNASD